MPSRTMPRGHRNDIRAEISVVYYKRLSLDEQSLPGLLKGRPELDCGCSLDHEYSQYLYVTSYIGVGSVQEHSL